MINLNGRPLVSYTVSYTDLLDAFGSLVDDSSLKVIEHTSLGVMGIYSESADHMYYEPEVCQRLGDAHGVEINMCIANDALQEAIFITGERSHDPSRQTALIWSVEDVFAECPHLDFQDAKDVLAQIKKTHTTFGVTAETLKIVAEEMFPVPYKDARGLYDGMVFLINNCPEETDQEPVTEEDWEKYGDFGDSFSCQYLVCIGEKRHLVLINEYDDCTMDNCFNGNRSEMERAVKQRAAKLAKDRLVGQCDVYYGHATGIRECDEIIVVIPVEMDKEAINAINKRIDELAYKFD